MTLFPNRFALSNSRAWVYANATFLVALGVILVVFSILGLLCINAPGLYMDAINPDYEVVKILHPEAPVTVWEAPGDLLFQRFPVMFELYAGSYVTYWMLPFVALFGDSILTVRIARVCFGLVFLCCVAFLTRRLTRSDIVALATSSALAVDPTFVYGLRTQAYVVLFPSIFVLIALYMAYRFRSILTYFITGVFVGLAAFGYFVYLFTAPGIGIFVLRDSEPEVRLRAVGIFVIGILVGLLPYALAYGLLFETLGWSGGSAWLHSALAGLHVTADNSYANRLVSTMRTIGLVLSGQWLQLTIWQNAPSDFGQLAKLLILVGLPFVAFLALYSASNVARRGFAIVLLAVASFILCATYFGPRLGGHDLTAVVMTSYVAGAVGASALLSIPSVSRTLSAIGITICVCVVVLINLISTVGVAVKLASNGGANFYSMAISQIPKDAESSSDGKIPYIFATWGEMMPFIYETGGTIPAFASDQLVNAVCHYGQAKVVLLGDDANFPDAQGPFPPNGLTKTSDVLAHDAESGFPYRLVSVRAVAPASNCLRGEGGVSVSAASQHRSVQANASPLRLKLTSRSMLPGVVFDAKPNPVMIPGGSLPVVTIHWVVPGASRVEIHAGSPDGQLFTAGGDTGIATTGPWVQAGDTFYLQDVSGGSPGKTVSTMSVSAT